VEVQKDCKFSFTKLQKTIKIQRNPKAMFNHIMQEEIYESIDAVDQATDFGSKFISNHQVVLGGFEKAKQELIQVQDLIIQAKGASSIAAQYGVYIMKELGIFNTIRLVNPGDFNENDLKDIKFGGFLTLTQSGNDKEMINTLRLAYKNNLTCFNIVNEENSPITTTIDEVQKEMTEAEQKKEAPQILFNSSDSEENIEAEFRDKNIGMYQKSGHCYSDVKSFIPQVICVSLCALWFSDKKQMQSI